ncbi:MAG: deacylase [Planctomycetota bacterium]|nr:MAG: deacylase [Planctomycetota bacterium]
MKQARGGERSVAGGDAGRARRQGPVVIAGVEVAPGTSEHLEIPVAELPTETYLSLPVAVVHGREPGPRLWLSATIHGDEANGIEIIRNVLERVEPRRLRGTLIAVPIVNVFGFIQQSRYLPDRRDLNRCFPGSPRGSLAARLAHLFMREVVAHCTHGIDLHTGANHRSNLPQIRADLRDRPTRRCAEAFNAPVMMHSRARDGSLREAATRRGLKVLLYEGGEAQRFDREAIEIGTGGVLRVMTHLGMGQFRHRKQPAHGHSVELVSSVWVRARRGGILRLQTRLGERVAEGQQLGTIADAFGEHPLAVRAPVEGIVIGLNKMPLVNQGDAIAHIGQLKGRARRRPGRAE